MVRRLLIVKLLAVNLLVAGFAVAVVWLAIDTLAAGYFVTLMEKYHISPEPAHAMFVDSVHRYLVWALLGAIALAVVLSYTINRRILKPLTQMTAITEEIAAGQFSARVPATTADEVGQLARAFNRMAENLEKIERLRRVLMIDVAHELRTPLTNMRGYLEALNDGVLPPAPETLALLQSETLRLTQLVEDVLALARADAAGGRLQRAPVDINELVENSLAAHGSAIEKKSLTIRITDTLPAKAINADADRLSRVLRNLTDKPSGMRRKTALSKYEWFNGSEWCGDRLCQQCDRSSPGRPAYLFERFYRGEKSRSRHHGGAGIGLSIVKELVQAHGGSVHARLQDGQVEIGFSLPAKP